MFLIRGSSLDLRKGWNRRDCLRIGLASTLGLGIDPVVSQAACALIGRSPGRSFGQAKSCILIYLFGGPSHIDIWDMKPAAPPEIRGEFKPRSTNVPGI